MRTGQRILSLVVIEVRLSPLRIRMAGNTVLAKFALMDIIFLVTRHASCFRFLGIERSGVALVAGQGRVTA